MKKAATRKSIWNCWFIWFCVTHCHKDSFLKTIKKEIDCMLRRMLRKMQKEVRGWTKEDTSSTGIILGGPSDGYYGNKQDQWKPSHLLWWWWPHKLKVFGPRFQCDGFSIDSRGVYYLWFQPYSKVLLCNKKTVSIFPTCGKQCWGMSVSWILIVNYWLWIW